MMRNIILLIIATAAVGLTVAGTTKKKQDTAPPILKQVQDMEGKKTLVVAGGCFWCVEAIYEELKGVERVESGYTGGSVENPTYSQVCAGTTGHAEAVKITYDPKVISESDLLHIFFTTHDPTTLNRQGADTGTQYRSALFFTSDDQMKAFKKVMDEVDNEKIWKDQIVTTLEPLGTFYSAESYHQDYYNKFEKSDELQKLEMNSGYCRAIIEPKVRKFRAKYADKLKK